MEDNVENTPKEMQETKSRILYITLSSVFVYMLYVFYSVYIQGVDITAMNLLIFTISAICAYYAYDSIFKEGIKTYNLFGVTYFCSLAINNLNICGIQCEKTWVDAYYFLAGAIVFYLGLWLIEKIKVHRIKAKINFNPNIVAIILIGLAVVLKVIIFRQVGIRLIDNAWSTAISGDDYKIPGISGLSDMLVWLCLMLVPNVQKKHKILIVFLAIVVCGVLDIKRGNIVRIMLFAIIVFLQSKKEILLREKRNIKWIMLIVLIFVVGFAELGNLRQNMRGVEYVQNEIKYELQSRVNNSTVNWLYGYTAINFEVASQIMAQELHNYSFNSINMPFQRFTKSSKEITDNEFFDAVSKLHGLRGFNASTMFGPMIYEMGLLYLIQVFLLVLQVGVFIWIAKAESASGHYAYLTTFASLAVFGNFFSMPMYFNTSVLASILFLFVDTKETGEKG